MSGRFDNCGALVLGAGVSGEAAAALLLSRGGSVLLMDEREECAESACAERTRRAGGNVLCGKTDLPGEKFGACVVSPAFPARHPWIETCLSRGVPVVSELELGAAYWRGKILAVTGSKGKSSLVKLCSDIFNGAGKSASPAGNYGVPLCRLALECPGLEWAVVEVSSFQMEYTARFRPDIAVLLNIQPDHLDRHADMAEYRALKLKMFASMLPGALALLPDGLDAEGRLPEGVESRRFGDALCCDWSYNGGVVEGRDAGRHVRVSLEQSWFNNEVLGLAAAAGVAAMSRAGVSADLIKQGLEMFEPLPHRLQALGIDRRGVSYVDDSKATSLAALAAALRMTQKPVRLIAGGLLKEKEPDKVKELLTQTTKKVYLIGKCAEELFLAWKSGVPCVVCGTLDRAVSLAVRESDAGDTVLLSPGTASFDQFKGYRERGERFTELVRAVADH
ncbi:MAG: UDP-N-acetylmuramoyl-L-alanine--D-glutamate ligase [Kiritimatiellae bacterium]|nr:UDP-N-acetylmuramoyl-L-alanine--D-glutamate ligase [Kiritimatiellia bacterium]